MPQVVVSSCPVRGLIHCNAEYDRGGSRIVTLIDWLVYRAQHYWERGNQIPLDLFAEMQAEGLDVVSLERQYLKQ